MNKEQIEQLGQYESSGAYTELEKTVIAFAEQFTTKATVDEATMGKLKESLSPEQLVKLAAVVAEANWTNRFNNTFGIELP